MSEGVSEQAMREAVNAGAERIDDLTPHEILVAARNLIAREGWVQGTFRREPDSFRRGGYCAAGAIQAVAGANVNARSSARRELGRVLGAVPITWNDACGRTEREVLAAFDEAIRLTSPEPVDLHLSELVA